MLNGVSPALVMHTTYKISFPNGFEHFSRTGLGVRLLLFCSFAVPPEFRSCSSICNIIVVHLPEMFFGNSRCGIETSGAVALRIC